MTELATTRLLAMWRSEDTALSFAGRGMPHAPPEAVSLFAELLPLLADLAALIGTDIPEEKLITPELLERLGAPADTQLPAGARDMLGLITIATSLRILAQGLERMTRNDAGLVEAALKNGGTK